MVALPLPPGPHANTRCAVTARLVRERATLEIRIRYGDWSAIARFNQISSTLAVSHGTTDLTREDPDA